jgi:YfiH family protein
MWLLEDSAVGSVAIPPHLPPGYAVFCTTSAFRGTAPFADDLVRVVRERFSLDTTLTTCSQVHGATVTKATGGPAWRECDSCDALWSDRKQTALGIKVADCLPVTMIDPVHSVIANVHSGWRGAVQRVTAATVETLERETAFVASSALAYLGPSIRTCCFEVGEEVVTEFASVYDDVERHVDRSYTKPHIDLVGLTAELLRHRGFADDRIFDSGLCTRCEGSVFHSYRRDRKGGGRNLQVVAQ